MTLGEKMTLAHMSLMPGVIDNEMIMQAMEEQGPQGEAGRLAKEEGRPIETATELRLEYKKILKVEHLWMMTKLVKLQLCNNIIEKIENLDALVNLKILDLSFNNIEQIENLDTLIELEQLTLFENKIRVLENIDHMTKLMVFSIGNNQLDDWNTVLYLRPFSALGSLNMAGNPCADEEHFREYVAAFLPHLVYYEYRMITMDERQLAVERYGNLLEKLEERERIKDEKLAIENAAAEEKAFHSIAFVEEINGDWLFEAMFAKDVEGNTLLKIGDEALEAQSNLREQMLEVLKEMFRIGIEQYDLRQKEIAEIEKCVQVAMDASLEVSREEMDYFIEQKTVIFGELHKALEGIETNEDEDTVRKCIERVQSASDKFNGCLHMSWYKLMQQEMTLFDQMEEANGQFERNMTDMVEAFIEMERGLFVQIRNCETTFSEVIGEIANRYMTTINTRVEEMVIPDDLQRIMVDKDSINNALVASHDVHLEVIDAREDLMLRRAREWCSALCEKRQEDEVKRNRAKATELSHFMEIQREEFDDMQSLQQMLHMELFLEHVDDGVPATSGADLAPVATVTTLDADVAGKPTVAASGTQLADATTVPTSHTELVEAASVPASGTEFMSMTAMLGSEADVTGTAAVVASATDITSRAHIAPSEADVSSMAAVVASVVASVTDVSSVKAVVASVVASVTDVASTAAGAASQTSFAISQVIPASETSVTVSSAMPQASGTDIVAELISTVVKTGADIVQLTPVEGDSSMAETPQADASAEVPPPPEMTVEVVPTSELAAAPGVAVEGDPSPEAVEAAGQEVVPSEEEAKLPEKEGEHTGEEAVPIVDEVESQTAGEAPAPVSESDPQPEPPVEE